jgi:protein-S-isoprenylcysteine O-methyltransferase Ste14
MSIDHVRATGLLLLATFLYQFASFARTHQRAPGGRPKEAVARMFLLETGAGFFLWLVAGVLLVARRTEIFHATGIVFGQAAVPRGLGLILFLCANALLVATRRTLGRNLQLAGLPPREGNTLVTTGPYRFVRHPLYLVSVLLGPSLALIVGSWLFLVPWVAILVTVPALIALEERRLEAAFGDAFRDYRRRTSRLIPKIW